MAIVRIFIQSPHMDGKNGITWAFTAAQPGYTMGKLESEMEPSGNDIPLWVKAILTNILTAPPVSGYTFHSYDWED